MIIDLAISPCPNDTFIFDALINKKIDTKDITFYPTFLDIQELNQSCNNQKFDLVKISVVNLKKVSKNYELLNSGAALGYGCGPLLITKNIKKNKKLEESLIGIPGKNTTAFFLLKYYNKNILNTIEIPFQNIEQELLDEKIDYGLIIHESRFTYQKKGLIKIVDLGEYWEEKTNTPIPLGVIILKKKFNKKVKKIIENLIYESVKFAFENPKSSEKFVKKYAQIKENSIIKNHIKLYVNKQTLQLDKAGKLAIKKILNLQ